MFVSQLAIKNELNVVEIIALSIDCCCCCSFFQWFYSVLINNRFKSINEPILFAFHKIFTWQTVIGHLPIILLFDESTYTRVLFILAFNANFKLYHTYNFNPIYLEAAQIYQEQLLITESRTYFIYCFWYGMIPSREVQILLWTHGQPIYIIFMWCFYVPTNICFQIEKKTLTTQNTSSSTKWCLPQNCEFYTQPQIKLMSILCTVMGLLFQLLLIYMSKIYVN